MASLPIVPSTEITNGEKNPLIITVLTVLVFLESYPPRQERCHCCILLGIYVSVAKFDANYGFDLFIP